MRFVVLDPYFLAGAFLAPKGRCRKLLVLLAYGRLVSNVERVNDAEMDKLTEEVKDAHGAAEIGGPIEELRLRETELRALLAERLPVMTPTEYGLATSPELLERVQALIQHAREDRPSLPTDAAALVYRRLSHHTARTVGETDHQWSIPRYTNGRAPEQEWLIHLATQIGAEFLVTRDSRIALDQDGPTVYTHEQTRKRTQAWRLDSFIEEIEEYHFALDEVDGELLEITA